MLNIGVEKKETTKEKYRELGLNVTEGSVFLTTYFPKPFDRTQLMEG